MDLFFHVIMVVLDVLALVVLARRPGRVLCLAWLSGIVLGLWALATVIGGSSGGLFAFMRFMATGVVVHLPIFLAGSGWIFFRAGHRPTGWAAGLGALLIAGAGVDAFWIEPRWLEVSRHTVRSAKVEKPFRIMVLADYQTDEFGEYEKRVWDTAQAQKADLIVMPGDYLQIHGDKMKRQRLMEATRDYLRQIRFGESARLGAFAIDGDVEFQRSNWARLFDGVPVTALKGTQTLELPELTLTALTLHDTRHNRDLKVAPSSRFHVSFGHAPDYALLDLDIDLQIAGHTHGGQLRVPGLGPLITFSRVPRSWAAGVTDLGRGRTLVVSRGLGMERDEAPRIRFLCRPEIVVLDVEPL